MGWLTRQLGIDALRTRYEGNLAVQARRRQAMLDEIDSLKTRVAGLERDLCAFVKSTKPVAPAKRAAKKAPAAKAAPVKAARGH